MLTRRACACAIALAALAVSPPLSAFCRTTTSNVPADYDPAMSGCWMHGDPLYWVTACVSYDIQQNASKSISYDQAAAGIAQAFSQWTSVACPTNGTGPSRVSIDVRDLGPVACDLVQYNQDGPNQHAIIFRDNDWPYNDSSNTLALTTVTYNIDTAEIYDADMEINSHNQTLTAWDPTNPDAPLPAGGYDFLSIVTHETGHFLGMAHSTDTHATMYAHYTQGSTVMRTLTQDDIAGICSIYSPDGTRNTDATAVPPNGQVPEGACDPTPRGGWTSNCMSTSSSIKCSVSGGVGSDGQTGRPFVFAVIALGALGAVVRRRRRH
jgi:MYXO-CTERM domain-containing protein